MRLLKPKILIQKNIIPIIILVFSGILLLSGFLNIKIIDNENKIASPNDAKQTAEDIVNKCEATGEQCYAYEFGVLTRNNKIDFVIKTLNEVQRLDEGTLGCHLIAHAISNEETFKDVYGWREVLKKVPIDRCTGGFLHGIFEARAATDKDFEINEKTIPETCKQVSDISTGNDQNCAHIMGHLLVVIKALDLDAANQTCSNLPEALRYECYSGVYMENETRDLIVDHNIGERIRWNKTTTQNQQELCEKAPQGDQAKACWRELSHMYAYISDTPTDLYNYCQSARRVDYIQDCVQHGTGIMVTGKNITKEFLSKTCSVYAGDNEKYFNCIQYAIGSLLASSSGFSDRAYQLCLITPTNLRDYCVRTVSDRLLDVLTREELIDACKAVPYPYNKSCTNPAL